VARTIFRGPIAALAILSTTALAGPSLAAPGDGADYHHGGAGTGGYQDAPDATHDQDHRGGDDEGRWNGRGQDQGRFDDRDYGQGVHDYDFGEHGRFYYRGDVRDRLARLEHWLNFLVRSRQISRWEAYRVSNALDSIRHQAFYFRRDGFLSWQERRMLNARLDSVVAFLRQERQHGFHGWSYNR